MSKPVCVSARPIATGILVRDADIPRKPARPTPPRIAPPRSARPRRNLWQWAVIAGSSAWALTVMTIALCASGSESPQPIPEAPSIIATAPAAIAAEQPIEAAEFGRRPSEPMLASRTRPAVEEEAPMLEIAAAAPPVVEPSRPEAAPVVEPRRPRKTIDLNVYANCAAIGTDILFVKDPPEAFRRAKAENKLVYMMHLSGNLEDPGFT